MPVLAVATTVAGKQMDSKVRSISAGWGRKQKSKAGMIVMPGRECVTNREYSDAELAATKNEAAELGITLNSALKILGGRTYDVYLNADAYWANVPERVWNYTLGGYQVIKKWLSYRELSVLNRPLTIDEIAYVSEMARRIAAILLMAPELDANYVAAKADALDWNKLQQVKSKCQRRSVTLATWGGAFTPHPKQTSRNACIPRVDLSERPVLNSNRDQQPLASFSIAAAARRRVIGLPSAVASRKVQ